MHPKAADRMAVSGFCFRSALVGSEWATAVLLCTNGLRKQSSPCTVPIASGEAFFPVWVSGCQLSEDYYKLVNGGVVGGMNM